MVVDIVEEVEAYPADVLLVHHGLVEDTGQDVGDDCARRKSLCSIPKWPMQINSHYSHRYSGRNNPDLNMCIALRRPCATQCAKLCY